MPVHVHSDEEEIFYVLGGAGLSWQDEPTYPVAAGDCILPPRRRPRRTRSSAGDEASTCSPSAGGAGTG